MIPVNSSLIDFNIVLDIVQLIIMLFTVIIVFCAYREIKRIIIKQGERLMNVITTKIAEYAAVIDKDTTALAAILTDLQSKLTDNLITPADAASLLDGPIARLTALGTTPGVIAIVLTQAQLDALLKAGFPFDPAQTTLTADQLQALVDAGIPYVTPTVSAQK